MAFCCDGLRNLISKAGGRGISAVIRLDYAGEPRVLLQSRGVSYDDQAKLKHIDLGVTINLSTQTGMGFCPACGATLKQVINGHPMFFQKLAKEHEKFVESVENP